MTLDSCPKSESCHLPFVKKDVRDALPNVLLLPMPIDQHVELLKFGDFGITGTQAFKHFGRHESFGDHKIYSLANWTVRLESANVQGVKSATLLSLDSRSCCSLLVNAWLSISL
jgi:hypothetical protein